MDANASLGRFYAFTTNTSATLPSTANPSDPQSRRDSSGTDSVSDDDGSASQSSHLAGRAPPGYGGPRAPYGTQNPPPFPPIRSDSAPATVYVDDAPYIPPGSSRPSQASSFVETGPDVSFNPPISVYNSNVPASMTTTTLYPTPYRRNSGDSSPTGSNDSGGSDRSDGHGGSSQESASSGVVSNDLPARDLLHGHDALVPRHRVAPPPGYNPEYYPAYDEHFRRVGMEHARFGTDPQHADNAHYRPRTHTYPSVGGPTMSMGMEHPEPLQIPNFPSPEMQLVQMQPDDIPFERGMRHDPFIPGQTRIELPSAASPQSYGNYGYGDPSSSHLRVGDDAYIPTSDGDIRRILGLSPDQELSLNALADPPVGQRPGQSIPTLSQLAILGSPQKRLTLQEIYQALEDRFEWFRLNREDKSWQNSIRHNLSLYKCFQRIAKPITEPGKGSYWVVDYSRGSGTKRPRKRNKRPTKAQLRAEREARESQQAQEVIDEGDSSPDGGDDDEGFPSPAQSVHDIPIDPVLHGQGHQVGQGRTRTSTRSIIRRGNSPYAQNVPAAQGYRQTASSPFPHIAQAGSRNLSATFGQPSFGQPSLVPPGMGPGMFGQGSIGGRTASSNWQPGMLMNQMAGQLYLPPPHPRPVGGVTGAVPSDATHHDTATRAHTLPMPVNMTQDMRGVPFTQLPPLPGIAQLRDPSGRFVARGATAATHAAGGPSQQFMQGSSRAGRGTSSSPASTPE